MVFIHKFLKEIYIYIYIYIYKFYNSIIEGIWTLHISYVETIGSSTSWTTRLFTWLTFGNTAFSYISGPKRWLNMLSKFQTKPNNVTWIVR